MTPSHVPSLKDLILDWVREQWPNYNFSADDAFIEWKTLCLEGRFVIGYIFSDFMFIIHNSQIPMERLNAADPEFFEKLKKHVDKHIFDYLKTKYEF